MIVLNPPPLDTSFVPEKLLFRENEINKLMASIIVPLKNNISGNVMIYGHSGTGKTATIKYLMKENPSIIYENGLSFSSVRQLLEHTITRLGKPTAFSGISMENIFMSMNSIMKLRGNMVLVIDEATNLLKNDSDGMYNIFRNNEIYNTHLSVVLITMDYPFAYLGKNYGTLSEIKFSKYNEGELFNIIRERSIRALKPGSYTDEILQFISSISSEFGSARFAIELLQKSAYLAEYRLSDIIENDDVRSAVSLINPYITESKLSGLNKKELIILFSICSNLRNELKTSVSDIYTEASIISNTYHDNISRKEVYEIINKLEILGIINGNIKSEGNKKGVYKFISIDDVPVSILGRKIENLLSRM